MKREIAEHAAETLKAVAHPIRLQIIELLEKGELSVGDIIEKLSIPQAVASQHLGLMKNRQVLQSRRDGTRILYSIKNLNVIHLLDCIYNHCRKTK